MDRFELDPFSSVPPLWPEVQLGCHPVTSPPGQVAADVSNLCSFVRNFHWQELKMQVAPTTGKLPDSSKNTLGWTDAHALSSVKVWLRLIEMASPDAEIDWRVALSGQRGWCTPLWSTGLSIQSRVLPLSVVPHGNKSFHPMPKLQYKKIPLGPSWPDCTVNSCG